MPFGLRRIALALVALSLLAAQPEPSPARAFEIKICQECRRLWDDSPSRMRAVADANGREKLILVCSPFCLAQVLKHKPHYELASTTMVAWENRDDLDANMINLNNAKLLIGVKDAKDLSHDPDVAAFRNDKQLASGRKAAGDTSLPSRSSMRESTS